MSSPRRKRFAEASYSPAGWRAKVHRWEKSSGISGGRGRGGQKFVALYFCRDTHLSVRGGFHPDDLAAAADVDVVGLRDLLWQGKDKLNLFANFEFRFGEKVQALVTDVPGLGAEFGAARLARKNAQWKAHRESPGYAAFRTVSHRTPC